LGLLTFYALTGRHYLRAMWQPYPSPEAVLSELTAKASGAKARARDQGSDLPASLDPWFSRSLNPDPAARFTSAGEAARAFAEAVAHRSAWQTIRATPQALGIAAAVAAPLVFQDLHAGGRPSSAGAAPSTDSPPVSSRPPGFAAPRARITEHVAGLPTRPPIALFAAAGTLLMAITALAVFALFRVFRAAKPPSPSMQSAASATVAAPPPAAQPAPPASATASADAEPKTQAHFVCQPVACEWIVCDGENVKKGQLDLDLSPGKHRCSASRYGYHTANSEFQIELGKTTQVRFELLPARAVPTPVKAAKPATPVKSSKSKSKPASKSLTTGKASGKLGR
jgi:hypothetical protein